MEKQEVIRSLLPSKLIEEELKSKARFVKETERGKNHIYIFSGKDCPNAMIQIGILREISFRDAGGGTGLSVDIDLFDEILYPDFPDNPCNHGFKQLIVWNPEQQDIIGGYRYALMKNLFINGTLSSPTEELFDFSQQFISDYLPYTVELGRSFVQPKYQARSEGKSLFALENLFDGLGSLVVEFKEEGMKYFFGKVTMYKSYNKQARNMILYYMKKHFPDPDTLVYPKAELIPSGLEDDIDSLIRIFHGNSEKDDKKILLQSLSELGTFMPPLIKKYTEMSPKMRVGGIAVNKHCGDVEEIALITKFMDIVPEYKRRYIWPFLKRLGLKNW